jgi:hypothetical protein
MEVLRPRLACWREHAKEAKRKGLEGLNDSICMMLRLVALLIFMGLTGL